MIIENEYLRVAFTTKGGSLTSIFDKTRNEELLYQPLENSWKGQDVFIFPFVARLKEGKYQVNGKDYSMKNHGLIRYMEGKEIGAGPFGTVTFESNEETLKQFPYSFKAAALYTLKGKTLEVSYVIKNTNDKDMPFMVGGHPAFKVPGRNESNEFNMIGNHVDFEKEMDLAIVDMDETCCFTKGLKYFTKTSRIDLSKRLFKDMNTIILKADKFAYVDLVKTDGSILRIHKNNIKYLAIWSDLQWGNYVAIEPWNGLPDELNPQLEFEKKNEITIIKPDETYKFTYQIEVIK